MFGRPLNPTGMRRENISVNLACQFDVASYKFSGDNSFWRNDDFARGDESFFDDSSGDDDVLDGDLAITLRATHLRCSWRRVERCSAVNTAMRRTYNLFCQGVAYEIREDPRRMAGHVSNQLSCDGQRT